MAKHIRQIDPSPINMKRSYELKVSLSRMAFDLASMKNSKAPIEEIDALECIWHELLKEYREIQVLQANAA